MTWFDLVVRRLLRDAMAVVAGLALIGAMVVLAVTTALRKPPADPGVVEIRDARVSVAEGHTDDRTFLSNDLALTNDNHVAFTIGDGQISGVWPITLSDPDCSFSPVRSTKGVKLSTRSQSVELLREITIICPVKP